MLPDDIFNFFCCKITYFWRLQWTYKWTTYCSVKMKRYLRVTLLLSQVSMERVTLRDKTHLKTQIRPSLGDRLLDKRENLLPRGGHVVLLEVAVKAVHADTVRSQAKRIAPLQISRDAAGEVAVVDVDNQQIAAHFRICRDIIIFLFTYEIFQLFQFNYLVNINQRKGLISK